MLSAYLLCIITKSHILKRLIDFQNSINTFADFTKLSWFLSKDFFFSILIVCLIILSLSFFSQVFLLDAPHFLQKYSCIFVFQFDNLSNQKLQSKNLNSFVIPTKNWFRMKKIWRYMIMFLIYSKQLMTLQLPYLIFS